MSPINAALVSSNFMPRRYLLIVWKDGAETFSLGDWSSGVQTLEWELNFFSSLLLEMWNVAGCSADSDIITDS